MGKITPFQRKTWRQWYDVFFWKMSQLEKNAGIHKIGFEYTII